VAQSLVAVAVEHLAVVVLVVRQLAEVAQVVLA
jgi:hypothetical protein